VAEAFARSFAASGGETVRLRSVAQARDWLAGFSGEFRSAAVSPDVPMDLRPELPQAEPASAELGVSLAVGAASATGSLLLSSRHGRALQLLPPVHLVWVDVDGIREGLEQALRVARSRGPLPAVLALHSGPSKSADIGRIVVTGVHGPGRVVAALLTRSGGEESILSRVGLP
jgi:L-lactate dehydrogenase complex protein LldG